MYPLILHEKAHDEYIEAYECYEKRQKGLGDKFMINVEKQLQKIREHPLFYGKLTSNFRQVKVDGFPFNIVYELFPRKKIILISAIYHARRHPRKKLRRK